MQKNPETELLSMNGMDLASNNTNYYNFWKVKYDNTFKMCIIIMNTNDLN